MAELRRQLNDPQSERADARAVASPVRRPTPGAEELQERIEDLLQDPDEPRRRQLVRHRSRRACNWRGLRPRIRSATTSLAQLLPRSRRGLSRDLAAQARRTYQEDQSLGRLLQPGQRSLDGDHFDAGDDRGRRKPSTAKFLGVIGLSVDVHRFVKMQEKKRQFAVLVDWRPGPNKGLILQHPLFDKFLERAPRTYPIDFRRIA